MDEISTLKYYLGANTAQGFHGLFDSFVSLDKGDFLWIIKGGAGCGKSSFMKMLGAAAERAGYCVEYAYCSGDPSSLDGVYIPALKCAYVDGTAPHIGDARLTALDSAYLNLGAFYDLDALAPHRAELMDLKSQIGKSYDRTYALLSAAGQLKICPRSYISSEDLVRSRKRIHGILKHSIPRSKLERSTTLRRFLSAITCRGTLCFSDTAETLCKNFYILSDSLGLGSIMLDDILEFAENIGHDIIACPDPLCPDLLEAVLLPGLSLGFILGSSPLAVELQGRHIRLANGLENSKDKKPRLLLKSYHKLSVSLVDEAVSCLAVSKSLHDKMEAIYNPNMDFDGVYSTAAKHMARLGLK